MNDWPTHQGNNQRNGITSQRLSLPMNERWTYISKHAPQPAWPPPARKDPWHRHPKLNPRAIFDRAYHVVSDGELVFFASSADEKIYCLNAENGQEKWSFFTEGPVRLAPTILDDKVYIGSDDGVVYCLKSADGTLVWKYRSLAGGRRIPGNQRIVSNTPVRTGVLIKDRIAYFCAGLFPNEGVRMVALNADDGTEVWARSHKELSPQGYLLASDTRLYVPTGRTSPIAFDIANGDQLENYNGPGGTYTLLTDDEILVHGTGDRGEFKGHPKNGDQFAVFSGLQMIVTTDTIYLLSAESISAIDSCTYHQIAEEWNAVAAQHLEKENQLWDLQEKLELFSARQQESGTLEKLEETIEKTAGELEDITINLRNIEKDRFKWQSPRKRSYAMIIAGDLVIIGGNNFVDVYRANDGELVWTESVDGKVYGLAVVNEELIVSTDQGGITCFGRSEGRKKPIVTDERNSAVRKLQGDESCLAKWVFQQTNQKKGYCFLLGVGDGRLAYELVKQSEYHIICVESDETKVRQARQLLDCAGIYGVRVSVHHVDSAKLPYTDYLANLIVVNEASQHQFLDQEIFRVLRPYGGVMVTLNQQERGETLCRGEIEGSGDWTHLYADASNTSCSNDQLENPTKLQWFGKPGPRKIVNRHSRPMSPLVKGGRVFVPADNRVIAADAYNGTVLWELEVPNSRRIGALKDSGQMVLSSEFLYIASRDQCQVVEVESGNISVNMSAPQLVAGETREWGYISVVGDQIFGSGKKLGASFYKIGRFNCDQLEGDYREMITSDYLFSIDRHTGRDLWTYNNDSVIFHNTIAVGDGRAYLIESQNPEALVNADGRMRIDLFCGQDTYLVALDQKTGAQIWREPFVFPFEHIMFLSYAQGIVLITGTYNVEEKVFYHLYAFDADTGMKKWDSSYDGGGTGGTHGEQWQHPVINGNKIYLRPYDFDLQTGQKGTYVLHRGGHGCGGLSGSANYLYGRGDNPRLYELGDEETSGLPMSRVNRPGCWINMIPANGMVIIPESSSGCTCAYPLQTSLCYIPNGD